MAKITRPLAKGDSALFLSRFYYDPELYQVVAIGSVTKPTFAKGQFADDRAWYGDNIFFCPALFKEPGIMEKRNVAGSIGLWVDVDAETQVLATFPPTYTIFSGHGWHLYYLLDEPVSDVETIEELNRLLIADVDGADVGSWNANRFLRVPGTFNTKDEPREVLIRKVLPVTYSPEDFQVLAKLSDKTRHKVRTGDRRGYSSRSHRDWRVILELLRAGASDALVTKLFHHLPIGDKVAEAAASYLPHTLAKAREELEKTSSENQKRGLIETDNGYVMVTSKGARRLSTFLLQPTVLLDGSRFEAPDALVCTVEAAGFTWTDITFSREAFTSVRRMDQECPVAAWQWLGSDTDLRCLLPFLMDKLIEEGLPKVIATPSIGLHRIRDRWLFVGDAETLSADSYWKGYNGPLAWLPSKREHPVLSLAQGLQPELRNALAELIPQLNGPEQIWPMLGWFAASCLKPWLEEQNYRFPVLNLTGARGSGKTTLIQRVFLPLFGNQEAKGYNAGTTNFVILSLLGSTNAAPICFSEFRYEAVGTFLRYILLGYDTGHDPRGRPDQTTIDYPLSAPFCLDGEDVISDPAAMQRVVMVRLRSATVAEDTPAYQAYKRLQSRRFTGHFGSYLQYVLTLVEEGHAEDVLAKAREDLIAAFPKKLPDRVRNNATVALFGARLWCQFIGLEEPPAILMHDAIISVHNYEAGRSRLLVDDMAEDVVNAAATNSDYFRWHYNAPNNVLYFQMATAYAWWTESMRRRQKQSMERSALVSQLAESGYAVSPTVINGVYMYGVSLQQALESGLDVPDRLDVNNITIQIVA